MEFCSSNPATIGVEMELQLLDTKSLDLVDRILPLLKLVPAETHIQPEFIQNTVEVASDVCTGLAELQLCLTEKIKILQEKCAELDVVICGAGTHPFSRSLATITPAPRYRRIEKTEGHISHTQITFATHVHIGMASGEEAVFVMRELKPYLPLLLALSASSPFWRGYDTAFASYRHRILAASRSYGIPPTFKDWEAFCRFLINAERANTFGTVHDIHWDIRPRPHLGSLEVRVMDAQPTVSDAVALGGFVRALIEFLRRIPKRDRPEHLPQALPWWFEKENHYQASRAGLDARFVNDPEGGTTSLRSTFNWVASAIQGIAEELGQQSYFVMLCEDVENRLCYSKQRSVYERTGSMIKVVESLVDELNRDVCSTSQRSHCQHV